MTNEQVQRLAEYFAPASDDIANTKVPFDKLVAEANELFAILKNRNTCPPYLHYLRYNEDGLDEGDDQLIAMEREFNHFKAAGILNADPRVIANLLLHAIAQELAWEKEEKQKATERLQFKAKLQEHRDRARTDFEAKMAERGRPASKSELDEFDQRMRTEEDCAWESFYGVGG